MRRAFHIATFVLLVIAVLSSRIPGHFDLKGQAFSESKETLAAGLAYDLKREGKIVVMSSRVDVSINKKSNKRLLGLSRGTTEVVILAKENKVQYSVDLSKIEYAYNGSDQTLYVSIPQAKLDESIVEVQSDPEKVSVFTKVGWARLDSRSGAQLRKEAMSELRERVIEAGSRESNLIAENKNAMAVLKELIYKKSLSLGVKVVIRSISEAGQTAGVKETFPGSLSI